MRRKVSTVLVVTHTVYRSLVNCLESYAFSLGTVLKIKPAISADYEHGFEINSPYHESQLNISITLVDRKTMLIHSIGQVSGTQLGLEVTANEPIPTNLLIEAAIRLENFTRDFSETISSDFLTYPAALADKSRWSDDDWKAVFNLYYLYKENSYPACDLRYLAISIGKKHGTVRDKHAWFKSQTDHIQVS